jgi:CRP/FNR family transcriptional regulator, cyclic AMP receptor protein
MHQQETARRSDAPTAALVYAAIVTFRRPEPRAVAWQKGVALPVAQRERLVRLLSRVDVLEPLSEEEVAELAERCPAFSVRGGEDFYSPQRHDSGLFLILEGRVKVYLTTPAGKEVTLDLLGGGTVLWVRRFEALQANDAVHVQAVGPSVLAFMGREDLDRFVLAKPEVGLRMMDLLAERLGQSNERMAEIAHKEVLSRLAGQVLRLLEDEGVVDRRGGYRLPAAYTHEELGTMIGANRVAVTRALGRLQEEGAVELRQRIIHVRDREALRRVAEQRR